MVSNIDGRRLRQVMGRDAWLAPEVHGNGFRMAGREDGIVIATTWPYEPDQTWIHASMSRRADVPSYWDLKLLHKAVFGDRWAYHVFPPEAEHINDHERCLHLWGRLDGAPALPEFNIAGSV